MGLEWAELNRPSRKNDTVRIPGGKVGVVIDTDDLDVTVKVFDHIEHHLSRNIKVVVPVCPVHATA